MNSTNDRSCIIKKKIILNEMERCKRNLKTILRRAKHLFSPAQSLKFVLLSSHLLIFLILHLRFLYLLFIPRNGDYPESHKYGVTKWISRPLIHCLCLCTYFAHWFKMKKVGLSWILLSGQQWNVPSEQLVYQIST